MTAFRLLEHFDRVGEAPGAVRRLRRFILDLAVRGKLVEQDPADQDISHLLPPLKNTGHQDGSEPKLQTDKNINSFDIPPSWRWVRLGDFTSIVMGQSPPGNTYNKDRNGLPLINGPVEFTEGPFGRTIVNQYTTAPTSICEEGDFLICVRGSTTGRTNIAGFRACIGRGVAAIRPVFGDQYVRLFIWRMRESIIAMGRGIAFPSVSRQQLESLPVSLPPIAEQMRIVAKVDEMMALCDQLEAAQEERESRRDRVITVSLRLNEPADAPQFREDVQFHLNYLARLTTRIEHVKKLRQTILDFAVRGRLVEQDTSDAGVSALLRRSDVRRQETARDDRRADTERAPLLAAEQRWSTPGPWEWRALADLALFVDYRGQTPTKTNGGVRLLTAKNIKKGAVTLTPEEFVSEEGYERWMTRGFPSVGDVLFTTEAPMGNAAVVRLTERFALAQRVICFRLYGALNPDFLVLQLLAHPFQTILEKTATGLTAKGIKAAKLKRLPIAVPPLAEQERIVARVDELMAVCDRLEAQIAAGATASSQLLEALLHEALVHPHAPHLMKI